MISFRKKIVTVIKLVCIEKTLESLPLKQELLPKMDLKALPVQQPQIPSQHITQVLEEEEPLQEIMGDFYSDNCEQGDIVSELFTGVDVCMYTTSKRSRPWVGRVVEVKKSNQFTPHWYGRSSNKSNTFKALYNDDCSPYIEMHNMDSVMFWAFAEDKTDSSFVISNYWMECVKHQYINNDKQ